MSHSSFLTVLTVIEGTLDRAVGRFSTGGGRAGDVDTEVCSSAAAGDISTKTALLTTRISLPLSCRLLCCDILCSLRHVLKLSTHHLHSMCTINTKST